MKKWLKVLIIVLIVGAIGGFIYYAFREVAPYDDTKKLFISCNGHSKSYSVLSSDKIDFAQKDDKCKLSIEVRNVERTFIKLKAEGYFYGSKANGSIDDSDSPFNDIYVEPGRVLTLYSLDKSTKFEFQYK